MEKEQIPVSDIEPGELIGVETDSDDLRGIVTGKQVGEDKIHFDLFVGHSEYLPDRIVEETFIIAVPRSGADGDIVIWSSVEVSSPLNTEMMKLYSGSGIYSIDISSLGLL